MSENRAIARSRGEFQNLLFLKMTLQNTFLADAIGKQHRQSIKDYEAASTNSPAAKSGKE